MSGHDLQQFITALETRGELARISVTTDPVLEIAAITDRVCKEPGGGRALLFENPSGSSFPVATNLFGSHSRTALALGVDDLHDLTGKLDILLNQIAAPELATLDDQLSTLPDFKKHAPYRTAPLWDMTMAQPDLTVFPFLQSWPGDGAVNGHHRYITLPQVYSAGPDGSTPNCGMYRAQILGSRELAIRWRDGSGAARHLKKFQSIGRAMPVTIALGGDPVCLFSALLPLPGMMNETTFAGFLRNAPIGMAPCRTHDLMVPGRADVVIEGFVDPFETVIEGPFGNHTGYYSPSGPAAVMRISSISYRDGAIIPATIVGPPPMEDCWMAKAWERLLLAFLKKFVPSVSDIHFPMEWIFHQSAIISLENPKPGMVREIAAFLWETDWFSNATLLIFADSGTAPTDLSRVAWQAINTSAFSLNMIADSSGTRLALDATGSDTTLTPLSGDPVVYQQVKRRWQEYGIQNHD
jgi:4-hydroxy-3-polyprenylbenzoate decarboxylase